MTANELRIGNWVYDKNNITQRIVAIEANADFGIGGYSCSDSVKTQYSKQSRLWIHEIDNIPLDSKWMEMFGFYGDDINGDAIRWTHKKYRWMILIQGDEDGFSFNYTTVVKYVNHLQNLFFVLCNEELIAKP